MFNNVQDEANKLIAKINEFWGKNVSNIQVTEISENPFNMFTLSMQFYQKHDVVMEYERSTLGISVKKGDDYIILSRLANEPIYRGLKSYTSENLLHNFKVLDKMLRSM